MVGRGILYLAETEYMLLAFDSTQQALRTEMLLDYEDISIDIRPTPKEITAGCALSIEFPKESILQVKEIVRLEKVELRGIFEYRGGVYHEIAMEEEV
jgi:hypothetical protein